MEAQTGADSGLKAWQQCALFLCAGLLLASRRPDALLHAQFYAEDGHVWFADAYNLGWWTTLFRTQDGYFQTLPRIGAALALHAPLKLAPLLMNLLAIAVQALPVNILLSARSSAWGSLRHRAMMAFLYLAIPNSGEMTVILTSTQWVLALIVFLLLVARKAAGIPGRVLDNSMVILCGLTGPFCLFLFPVAIIVAWNKRDVWRWMNAGLIACLCFVQAYGLLIVNPHGRSPVELGASAQLLIRIVAGQVYLGTLLGSNGLSFNPGAGVFIFLVIAAMAGTAVMATGFARAGFELRLFIFLALLLFTASLISPAAYPPPGITRWEMLARVPGIRYWFFPDIAFAWTLLALSQAKELWRRILPMFLLAILCFGIARDWRHPALKDLHFAEDAKRFDGASEGTTMTIAINPQGWNMELVKR